MRLQLRELQTLKKQKHEAFFARVREARQEAQAAREAAGDFSTPVDRIHARLVAERLLETAAAAEE
jgi:hypothetical protein